MIDEELREKSCVAPALRPAAWSALVDDASRLATADSGLVLVGLRETRALM